jgi:Uma2 family endonuclease
MTTLRTPEPPETAQQLMTAEEFAQLPNDGRRLELVHGVVVDMDEGTPMSRPKQLHGIVAANLMIFVGGYIKNHRLGQLTTEAGFILARDPDVVRGPDFAFVRNERALLKSDRNRYYSGAPDLAAEIVSPNDTAEQTRALIDEYMAAGAQAVWIVYPLFETVEVHRPNGTASVLRSADTLDGEDVLPSFSLPVAALFE